MIAMVVSIRKGYSVWSTETERVGELKGLKSRGVINLKADEWQTCRKCGTPNILDENFRREKISNCANCGRTIQLSRNVLTRYTVSSLNYRKILKICGEKLSKSVGKGNCTYDKDQRIWICSKNSRKIPVFVSEVSSYNQYLSGQSDSGWLCIVLDWEKEKGILNYYNKIHFTKFEDVLEDRIDLSEVVGELTASFNLNVTLELKEEFEHLVSSMTPSEFEKQFIEKFLNGIQKRADLLTSFFNFLSIRKNTITNSKIVLMGGPANPDFAVIDLLKYLQEGLKPERMGEAKRYLGSTTFTVSDFGTAQAHAIGADTVFILSTNKIQPEVWRLILITKNKEGYFKHVIIDKDTILLLIDVLKMNHLLSQ